MATLVVTFAFPSDAQGFAATVGANTVASWQSADGSSFPPDVGCLQFRISGRNKTNANNTYSRTMTFEDMGVPVGATVTGITSGSAYFRCREWVTGATTNLHDGVFLTPSGSSQITIAAATSAYTNTSLWAQSSGVNSTGLSLASSTSCAIRWQADLATLKSDAAVVTLACDTITFTVTYESGVSANPPTAFATGGAGILDVTQGQTVSVSGVSATSGVGAVANGAYGPGLTLLLSLNLDQQDVFNGVAPVSGIAGAGAAGAISVTEGAVASLTGTSALGRAGGAYTSDTTLGSLPLWSLVLEAPGDTAFKYSTDTLTPAFTEDALSEVWVEDDTEGFVPRLVHAAAIQLGNSISADMPSVVATSGVGSLESHYGSSVTIAGVRGVSDTSQAFQFLQSQSVPATGVAGTSRVGVVSVVRPVDVEATITWAEATGRAGTPSVSQDAVTLSGVSVFGSANNVGIETDASVSIVADNSFATGRAGSAGVPSQQAQITGVSATGRAGAVSASSVIAIQIDVPVSGVSASTEAGDADASGASVVGIVGIAATPAVSTQTVDLQLSGPITGVIGTSAVGILTSGGDAIVNLTGLGVTGTAANMIINPGMEGRPIRRAYPGRGHPVRVNR